MGCGPNVFLVIYPICLRDGQNPDDRRDGTTSITSGYPIKRSVKRILYFVFYFFVTLTSLDACKLASGCFIPFPTCQIIGSGGCPLKGHSPQSSSYQTVLNKHKKYLKTKHSFFYNQNYIFLNIVKKFFLQMVSRLFYY